MAKADISVQGRAYSVACAPGQETRLQALGAELDSRVRAIAGAVGDIGEARLLLVAALALLDELEIAKRAGPPPADLEVKTIAAMSDAAERIARIAERVEAGGP
ncbi:MAG: cell division protein ZapA [Pseudomonadota bacterium]